MKFYGKFHLTILGFQRNEKLKSLEIQYIITILFWKGKSCSCFMEKKNYLLYFLFGFFEHRWHHKSCNVSENCRACLQRSAEEPSIGMIQAGHSIKEARFWNYFMLQSVSLFLWEFIVLISSNLSNDSWGEKICKLLCSCIVIIKVSMCYTRSSKVPEVLLTFDESPGFRQDCYILDSYWRNPELNAKAT